MKFVLLRRDKVVDFHWNASDPWTIVSVSDDCGSTGGGGTLQVSDSLFFLFRLNHKSAWVCPIYYTLDSSASSMSCWIKLTKYYWNILNDVHFVMMQIWRMIDLIYRPEDEVLGELDKHRSQQSFDKENNARKAVQMKSQLTLEQLNISNNITSCINSNSPGFFFMVTEAHERHFCGIYWLFRCETREK